MCHRRRRSRTRWRSFVHRARSGLRNNHPRGRRLRRRSDRWSCRTRNNCRRSWRRGRCGRNNRRGCRSSWRYHRSGRRCWRCGWTRRWCNGRSCNRSGRSRRFLDDGRHYHRTRRRRNYWCRNWSRRRHWCSRFRCRRRHNCRLRRDRRGHGPQWRRSRSFLLLRNGSQHISRSRDVRQINLGLDFFFAAQGTCRARRGRLRFGRAADVGPHFFRFVLLQRTGMGLLLRHTDER
jgi:hypothetical protein